MPLKFWGEGMFGYYDKAGFGYFEAVNQTADAIIAAGDPADPIASDARWPSLG